MPVLNAKAPDALAARHPELLGQLRAVLSQYPQVMAAYVFGSYARGDERPDSDLDVYIEIDRSKGKFSLLDLAGLQLHLEAEIEQKVDIGTQMAGRLYAFAADDLTLVHTGG